MDFKAIKPHLILAILLGSTLAAVHFLGKPGSMQDPGVNTSLPKELGSWKGTDVFHCINSECMASFADERINEQTPCPFCDEPISSFSRAETLLLPKDTLITRKQYENPAGERIVLTILITGTQRSSIHKPEWCLPAQGYSIVSTKPHVIPIKEKDAFTVRLLELTRERNASAAAYAYWFSSRGRETGYHLKRIVWMASDSMFRNTVSRWAFISVATELTPGSNAHLERINGFVAELYPLLTAPPAQGQDSTLTP